MYRGVEYGFEKWYVYDEFGGVVLDAPREISVYVPSGRRYRAVAVYEEIPKSSLTVETNIDDLLLEEAVKVNENSYSTPALIERHGEINATLEALPSVLGLLKVDSGLPESFQASTASVTSKTLTGNFVLNFKFEPIRGTWCWYCIVRVFRNSTKIYERWFYGAGSVELEISDLRNEFVRIYVATSGSPAEVYDIEMYEKTPYSFVKWIVYDSKGDVVLDAPRTIEVVVPAGEGDTAVAYYGSSPSLLLVNSSPTGVGITVNGSTIETTPFYLALAGKNLEASRVMI